MTFTRIKLKALEREMAAIGFKSKLFVVRRQHKSNKYEFQGRIYNSLPALKKENGIRDEDLVACVTSYSDLGGITE